MGPKIRIFKQTNTNEIVSDCALDGQPLTYWIRPQTAERLCQPLEHPMDATELWRPQPISPRLKMEATVSITDNAEEGYVHADQEAR